MAPTKTICKNSEKFSYSGKEMSPLGLGYCADAESVGTEMLGRDGKNWVVGVKNNDKIWMRAPEKPLTPEEPVLTKERTEAAKPEPAEDTDGETDDEMPALIEDPNLTKPKPAEDAKPKRKYTKKSKKPEPAEGDNTEPSAEAPAEKPKRKYTKKPKTPPTTEEGENTTPAPADKKERKKRGPSGYNLYIGKIMKELREKTQGLKTTDYMKQAQELWGAMTKEEQKKVSEELKAAAAPEA